MPTTCTRRFEWDAAHRVLRHESKCAHLHGHRYVAEVTFGAEALDEVSRVIDFGAIKEQLGKWIDDEWDHTTLVNEEDTALVEFCAHQWQRARAAGKVPRKAYRFKGEPTAENIAAELLRVAKRMFNRDGLWVEKVRIWETPNCWAEAT